MRRNRRTVWLLLAMGLLAPCVAVAAMAHWWTAPQLYRAQSSADGGWSVRVLRSRNVLYTIVDGVKVGVEGRGRWDELLLRDLIDSRDRWDEVEERYPVVICRNDSILVGPHWSDGTRSRYYWVARDGLTHPTLRRS